MQLKCPGCSRALNVPDTAAGKVVKCPCGKQLRAPAGATKPATQSPNPAQRSQAAPAKRAAPARPVAARGGAAGANPFGVDADLFDELTDTDLQPVAVAAMPGAKPAAARVGKATEKLLAGAADNTKHDKDLVSGENYDGMPGFMLMLGAGNFFLSCIVGWKIYDLQLSKKRLADLFGEMGGEDMALDVGSIDGVINIMMGIYALYLLICLITSVCCFIPKRICWYVVLVSYSFAAAMFPFNQYLNFLTTGMLDAYGIVVGAIFLCTVMGYLHQGEACAYYRVGAISIMKPLTFDAIGIVSGLVLGGFLVFLATL